jgi:hypothetical protein
VDRLPFRVFVYDRDGVRLRGYFLTRGLAEEYCRECVGRGCPVGSLLVGVVDQPPLLPG